MDFVTYVRKPFTVKAVMVTEENMEEIAKQVGEIRETEDETPARKYIFVDRRIVPNVFKVFPGFYMTKMGDNIRFYSKKVFNEQFTEQTPEITNWVDYMNGNTEKSTEVVNGG